MFIVVQLNADRGEAVRFVVARNPKPQRRRFGSDPSLRFTACDRRGVRSVAPSRRK